MYIGRLRHNSFVLPEAYLDLRSTHAQRKAETTHRRSPCRATTISRLFRGQLHLFGSAGAGDLGGPG